MIVLSNVGKPSSQFKSKRTPFHAISVQVSHTSADFSSKANMTAITLSYVHIVTALAGAALSKLTVKPRYKPRRPSCFQIVKRVLVTPVYLGMLRWTYRSSIGPCTCNRFRVVSRGYTAVLDKTLARMPATASEDPSGSGMGRLAIAGFKLS